MKQEEPKPYRPLIEKEVKPHNVGELEQNVSKVKRVLKKVRYIGDVDPKE